MANDLHELLRMAAVPPPYVHVGASGDGFPVRVFAATYPNDVAGVVLLDARHEDQQDPRSSFGWANRAPATVRRVLYTVAPTARQVGLIRLMLRPTEATVARRPPPQGMSPDEARYLYFLSRLPKSFVTSADEARNLQVSADQARKAGNLGDRPLIVLTAGKFVAPDNPADIAEARAFHRTKLTELQPKLARLSSRGRHIILENSDHGIQFEAPDAVIAAIREIVLQNRREQQW
jgi:pimeloyl-ACP methyl ester carboxylesterase